MFLAGSRIFTTARASGGKTESSTLHPPSEKKQVPLTPATTAPRPHHHNLVICQALRARLGDRETELQHTRDMLETARSAASTAEERADRCQMEASEAEVTVYDPSTRALSPLGHNDEAPNRSSVAADKTWRNTTRPFLSFSS